jgi:hypothetical protein
MLGIARLVLLALLVVAWARAADAPAAQLDAGEPPKPGHEAPTAPAESCVVRFTWDEYRTLVVVGTGVGMVKPAWVVTYELDGDKFIVGYRATAFRDARGRLHIDARHSRDVGPNAANWIPDSFAFGSATLWTLDDQGNGHASAMGTLVTAEKDPAGWQAAHLQIQALVEGGL